MLERYERKVEELQNGVAQLRARQLASGAVLALAAAMVFVLGLSALQGRVPVWWPAAPVPFAAAAALQYRRRNQAGSRLRRLVRFYRRAVQRVDGQWAGEGFAGDEFEGANHVYACDLGLFGEGSLFELLCIARTGIGRRGLAHYLLAAPALDETRQRQDAVRELQDRGDLRESIALLGEYEFSESKWETFAEWLKSPEVPFDKRLAVAGAVTSSIALAVLLSAIFGLTGWLHAARLVAPLMLFQGAVGLFYRDRVKRMMDSLRLASVEIRTLREGLQLLEREPFRCSKLGQIKARVRNSSSAVRNLEMLLGGLHLRNKDWFYQASLFLMAATQLCMAVERWRTRHGAALQRWLEAWAEFEALHSLANYAHENPSNAFAELADAEICFEAVEMGNPLIAAAACVRNSLRLNSATRFCVVSGSNMSGKSSLLRAVGLNAVLALTGAPVPAQALRLSRLSVCASLAVVDSLLNGKSKFLAEVDRVRQSIALAAAGEPVLFLIDEIFSGTNSSDRRTAAEAVVRTLLDRGAIGALSTHDMSLTEIANASELQGVNVHMGSRDGSDPMDFDYRLKPGVTRETNALAIARMAGVPV